MRKYRTKIALIIVMVFVVSIIMLGIIRIMDSREVNAEEISDKVIRFHVIANSDTDEDQNLKIKVKNDVIKYMYNKLNESDDLDKSREIIISEMENLKKIAEKKIAEEGYDYNVKIVLGNENFPEKRYGEVVLPHGEYEALRIIIGEGNGKNWWCVMFPPLCFIDVTLEDYSFEDIQITLDKHLSEEDVEKILEKEKNVEFKLKFLEWFKKEK
ncbi:stage II sporulation protein R [Oceanirhabdus sp. W0125-5]|uniref:stage II sporulation protein R n=1 Tax=Oceanirhabdus sp. W0125-5 TaxID=2999116 RepID=UPI0022F32613|nr:stage II sporulation protein R [Oceanirhabdus sp. W0125-5]WBW98465.1 stage II sporulation protein R [Oceanirhabdus sp. W0125-5]